MGKHMVKICFVSVIIVFIKAFSPTQNHTDLLSLILWNVNFYYTPLDSHF